MRSRASTRPIPPTSRNHVRILNIRAIKHRIQDLCVRNVAIIWAIACCIDERVFGEAIIEKGPSAVGVAWMAVDCERISSKCGECEEGACELHGVGGKVSYGRARWIWFEIWYGGDCLTEMAVANMHEDWILRHALHILLHRHSSHHSKPPW